jgi:arginase family enzyme
MSQIEKSVEAGTTAPELIKRMEKLADDMRHVSADLMEYSPNNATELFGAAGIVNEWVKHLREDCEAQQGGATMMR